MLEEGVMFDNANLLAASGDVFSSQQVAHEAPRASAVPHDSTPNRPASPPVPRGVRKARSSNHDGGAAPAPPAKPPNVDPDGADGWASLAS